MNVIGHEDKGVKLVAVLATVMLKCAEKELSVRRALEEAFAIPSGARDEIGARSGQAFCGERHAGPSVPQRLKPLYDAGGLRHG